MSGALQRIEIGYIIAFGLTLKSNELPVQDTQDYPPGPSTH